MLRALIVALVCVVLAPAAASAAVVTIELQPARGADYGETHSITGKLTGEFSAPLVGRQVVLEAHRYPYRRPFAPIATAMTGLDGRFAFERAFDVNQRVRVFVPETGDRSRFASAYVFPRTKLTFSLVRRNVVRVVQTYRTPDSVKLTAPTLFYVGRAGKKAAPLAARSKTKKVRRKGKVRKGRFRSTAVVRIPRAWRGRFRYASCFPYNAGMGNPTIGCPKKKYRF